MHKYYDGKRWIVAFGAGEQRQETAALKLDAAMNLAVRIARREVLYLVGRPAVRA